MLSTRALESTLYANAVSYSWDQALSIGAVPHVARRATCLRSSGPHTTIYRTNRNDSTLAHSSQVAVRRQCMTSAGRFLGWALLGTALIGCTSGRTARPVATGGRDFITQAE